MTRTNLRAAGLAILQVGCFGAGYVRLRLPARAAGAWAALVFLPLASQVAFPVRSHPWAAPVLYFAFLAITLYCVWDAFRRTRRMDDDGLGSRAPWWMVGVYVAVVSMAMSFLQAMRPPFSERLFGASSIRVTNLAMEPAILSGDSLVIDTSAYGNTPPAVGDVVAAYAGPSGKRVVARVVKTENGSVWLELDNKAWIGDSDLGRIPAGAVSGRIVSVWFSSDLGRIGMAVK